MRRILLSLLSIALLAISAAPAAHATDVNYVDKVAQTSLTTVATTLCAAPLNTGVATMSSAGFATESITVTGTWTGTISWYGYADGVTATNTWVSQLALPQQGGAPVASTTANGTWFIPVTAYGAVCVEFSSAATGTAVVTQRLSLRERPFPSSTAGAPFECTYGSTSTTSVQLAGCAIQAGMSFYITGVSISGDTITSATNPATIQAGASTTCTTPTVLYQAHHLALTTVTWSPPTPIKAAQGAGLCLLDPATGSKYVTVVGYTAP